MGNSDEIIYTLSDDGLTLSVKCEGDLLEELQNESDVMKREALIHEAAYEPHYTFATADSFGANLSEAPCFLEQLDIHDNGDSEAVGDWFFYNGYMIHDFTAILARGETVNFTKVT